MTWSILARDQTGRFGVAIASRFFAVGALCVHARRGVGVLATQALMNPLYGPAGIAMLADGWAAADAIAALVDADAGQGHRQLHLLPAAGAPAAHTGDQCIDWCGHSCGNDYSVAGNMLAGEAVIAATVSAWVGNPQRPLAERLLIAMRAGEAAGGDKRGRQAAALRIQGDEDHAELDLRVDDHADPLAELQRLYEISQQRYQPFVACLPGRHDAVGVTDRAEIEQRIAQFQLRRAAAGAPPR